MVLQEDLKKEKLIILSELRKRLPWMIRLRWWVPPTIAIGTLTAWTFGIQFAASPILSVGILILFYNIIFAAYNSFLAPESLGNEKRIESFAYWQVSLDLAMVAALVFFSGGPASPFIFFFIFHIIFAAMLLKPRSAWWLAGAVSFFMIILYVTHAIGWIGRGYLISFHGRSLEVPLNAFPLFVQIFFFCASIFITTYITTAIMGVVRRRIVKLAELSEDVMTLNERFRALHTMSKSIVSTLHIDAVLNAVTSELVKVTDVQGITVKLLSDDGRYLRYAAIQGLPDEVFKNKVLEVERSPLNKRIIEGEPFVTGYLTESTSFQSGEELLSANIQSVLFVPLKTDHRVLGILGAYCNKVEKFNSDDVDFFGLASELVAIALENARAYKAVEDLMSERSVYMTRVAHNLRAPIAAMVSLLDVILGGYVGEMDPKQKEYLLRVDRRARSAVTTVNQLMILAKSRNGMRRKSDALIDIVPVARKIFAAFQGEAEKKNLRFELETADQLPPVKGDGEMIEQLLENILSNAVKYTPKDGRVLSKVGINDEGALLIEVTDSGIGIAEDDLPKLFQEYYRAKNARLTEEIGTGLGLSIVKEIVEQHHGTVRVESRLGQGTSFFLTIPQASMSDTALD